MNDLQMIQPSGSLLSPLRYQLDSRRVTAAVSELFTCKTSDLHSSRYHSMALQGDGNEHIDYSDVVESRSSLDRSTSTPSADPSVTAPYNNPDQAWARSIPHPAIGTRPRRLDLSPGSLVGNQSALHDYRHEIETFNSEQLVQASDLASEASEQGNGLPSHHTELVSPSGSATAPRPYVHLSPMSQIARLRDIPLGTDIQHDRHPRRRRNQPVFPDSVVSSPEMFHPPSALSQMIPVWEPLLQQGFARSLVDMKGLSYVGAIDHNLLCPICYCPFDSPLQLPCEHYFCRACIAQSLESQDEASQSCPACRQKVSRADVSEAPRVIRHIVDDLKVRCPRSSEGCDVEMPRSSTQDHLDRHCAFAEVRCPDSGCSLPVPRKEAALGRCLHQVMYCNNCNIDLMELNLEAHNQKYCTGRVTSCPDCKNSVRCSDLEAHVDTCPYSSWPCPASLYGCEFVGVRSALDLHTPICALAKLVPFLKKQNEMLDTHEAALKHLQHKNFILEASFRTIQDTLTPNINLVESPASVTPTIANGPFDSTAHHLLCLHESLREEVSRVAATVSELDAKTSMTFVNESLRLKEDMSHTNSAINAMRLQLQWLVSARLQNQQKTTIMRTQRGSSGEDTPGPSDGCGQPGRRISDLTRQETKL